MDVAILDFIQNNMVSPEYSGIMIFFTKLGGYAVVWVIGGVALLFFKRYRFWGAMLLTALVFTVIVGEFGIKNLVQRPRPFVDNPNAVLLISPPQGSSFPSMHSATSFACAFVVFRINKKLGVVGFFYSACVAFSRMYLYVHYPSDILAGVVLGLICGWLVYTVFTGLRIRRLKRQKGEAEAIVKV